MSLRALSIRLCAQARTRSFSSSSSRSNASRYGCSAVWHRPVPFPSAWLLLTRAHSQERKRPPLDTHTHLDLCKEVSEAAFGVHLKRRRQVQYELHDDGLVGHLLHQAVFLGEEEYTTLQFSRSQQPPAPPADCLHACVGRCSPSCLPESLSVERSVQNWPFMSQRDCGVCPSFEVLKLLLPHQKRSG